MKAIGLKDPLVRFLFLWLLMPFLLFSASAGKLGTYILPCLVPLSILAVTGIIRSLEMKRDKPFFFGTLVLTILLPLLLLAVVVNEVFNPFGMRLFGEGEAVKKNALMVLGVGVWVSLLVLALRSTDTKRRLALFILGPVVFFAAHPFLVPGGVLGETAPRDALIAHRDLVTPDTILISEKEFPSAVAWYYDRADVRFLTKTGYTVSAGLSYMDNTSDYILGLERTRDVITGGDRPVVIILSEKYYERYRESLPAPGFLDEQGGLVFLGYSKRDARSASARERASLLPPQSRGYERARLKRERRHA
jgi:4-amino-4-deoxy-L-arabinose transferase